MFCNKRKEPIRIRNGFSQLLEREHTHQMASYQLLHITLDTGCRQTIGSHCLSPTHVHKWVPATCCSEQHCPGSSSNRPFQLVHFVFHFRPRDATRGNSLFQMSSYARANLRITNEKTKGKFP